MIEQGFDPDQNRAIEIKRLAKTFLAAQGEVDRMSRLNDCSKLRASIVRALPRNI